MNKKNLAIMGIVLLAYIGGLLTNNLNSKLEHDKLVLAYVQAFEEVNAQRKSEVLNLIANDEHLLLKTDITNMVMNLQPIYKIQNTKEYINAIYDSSITNDVPPEIIISIIATESSFRRNVKSHVGAIGPMQVLPSAWESLNYDPSDFYDNIQMGGYIIKKYKDSCGNWKCAFKAYNVGIGNYKRNKQLPAQKRYITKIENILATIY